MSVALTSVDPATGQTLETYETMARATVRDIAVAAAEAQQAWCRIPVERRVEALRQAARILRERRDELAALMAREMGKPVSQGRGEADKCAWLCEHYADRAPAVLSDEPVDTEEGESFVTYRPLGTVLGVMPWNFPLWQVFRFAVPAVAAGNAALLKHASSVPGCAVAVEEILRQAGLPQDIFRTLLIGSDDVDWVIGLPQVQAISLTGSDAAGRKVAARAGSCVKKTVLELGGSDPYVILGDADLEKAAELCAQSRLTNSGQSCIAAKRFIVVAERARAFGDALARRMAARTVGSPLDDDTEVGPLARHDLRDDLHRQVRDSIDAGAGCPLGGELPTGDGAYYPVTVLTGVRPGMAAFDEELFGPVAAVIEAADEADAVRLANDSAYGLGAGVFTADVERGRRIAVEELEAGSCAVNDFVRSDPRLPFGGVKASGYGRELSHYGLREFVNVKAVHLA